MSEQIYVLDEAGNLVEKEGGREPGRRYSDIGRGAAGAVRLREWAPAEEARRDAEEAEHAAHANDPPPVIRDPLAEIDALKVEVEKLKAKPA